MELLRQGRHSKEAERANLVMRYHEGRHRAGRSAEIEVENREDTGVAKGVGALETGRTEIVWRTEGHSYLPAMCRGRLNMQNLTVTSTEAHPTAVLIEMNLHMLMSIPVEATVRNRGTRRAKRERWRRKVVVVKELTLVGWDYPK